MSNADTGSPLARALAAFGSIEGSRLVLRDGIGREVASMDIEDAVPSRADEVRSA
jgi:hypothetical protein